MKFQTIKEECAEFIGLFAAMNLPPAILGMVESAFYTGANIGWIMEDRILSATSDGRITVKQGQAALNALREECGSLIENRGQMAEGRLRRRAQEDPAYRADFEDLIARVRPKS